MTKGILVVSAAILVVAAVFAPAVGYSFEVLNSPYPYSIDSGSLSPYSIGSEEPYKYSIDCGDLPGYSLEALTSPYPFSFEAGFPEVTEVVTPTEEVVTPTEEVVTPTEEVVTPTEEVVTPTEEAGTTTTEETVTTTETVVVEKPGPAEVSNSSPTG